MTLPIHCDLKDWQVVSAKLLAYPKTKRLAVGPALSENNNSPVPVDGSEIEMVQEFTYLGSKLSCDGEITPEVSYRIAKALVV